MYVCMYARTYGCIMYVYVCMRVYSYVYLCKYVCMYVCMYVCSTRVKAYDLLHAMSVCPLQSATSSL